LLCASYKLFGIGLLSSRLPFLVAGCGVLWLTWRLGRELFGSVEGALLGAIVMAANVQTMTIATRSTPDMFLCLFVSVSLCGFAPLLLGKSDSWRSYAMAYLGAGLACATKGLWGAIPVLFAGVLWALQCRRSIPLNRLAPAGWVLAGVLVGGGWFMYAAVKHGSGTLGAFFRDQTAATATPAKWFLISNVADYAAATLRHFLPFSLLLAAAWFAARPQVKEFFRRNRLALWFVLGWYVLVFGIFSFGFMRRTRYLLPTYPGLAVMIGALLVVLMQHAKAEEWVRRLSVAILAVGIVFGLGMAVMGLRLDWRLALAGGIVAGSAGGVVAWMRNCDALSSMAGLGAWVIVVAPLVTGFARPVFTPNYAADLTRELSAQTAPGQAIVALGVRAELVSQIRLLSAGRLEPKAYATEAWPAGIPGGAVCVVAEDGRERLAAAGYRLTLAGYRAKGVRASDVWRAWRSGQREELFSRKQQNFYVATPP
ncbi:MAG: glycosyltransferase family 39 protein, partial [Verrucomicrobia subdivision 3 bacterium]|nr:glycosyltransferase family 39 protein [Limisphaerales bacterium]